MPKPHPDGTKAARLELAKLAEFLGLSRLVLVGVSAWIALITRGANLRSSLYCPVRAARVKFVALSRR